MITIGYTTFHSSLFTSAMFEYFSLSPVEHMGDIKLIGFNLHMIHNEEEEPKYNTYTSILYTPVQLLNAFKQLYDNLDDNTWLIPYEDIIDCDFDEIDWDSHKETTKYANKLWDTIIADLYSLKTQKEY